MNLYEKISAVAIDIMNIEKDMQVGSGNYGYKATSDTAVTLAVKKSEEKHKLISIPVKQELVSSEVLRTVGKDGKESVKFVDNVKMTIKIIDLEKPEDFIEIESFGKGVDTGDKGFGKASTYARKYGLLNAYKIATGEDPDANKSEQINTPKTIDEKRVLISNYFEKNLTKMPALLKHFGVNGLEELSQQQVDTVFKSYRDKNLL